MGLFRSCTKNQKPVLVSDQNGHFLSSNCETRRTMLRLFRPQWSRHLGRPSNAQTLRGFVICGNCSTRVYTRQREFFVFLILQLVLRNDNFMDVSVFLEAKRNCNDRCNPSFETCDCILRTHTVATRRAFESVGIEFDVMDFGSNRVTFSCLRTYSRHQCCARIMVRRSHG